jgi:hypothetical protein
VLRGGVYVNVEQAASFGIYNAGRQVTKLNRLARSIRDFLNTLAAIAGKKPGVQS